jgi:uncharacterized protein with FMN-binding domain
MTVKRAPWLVTTGAVAGFAGVIGLHIGAAAPMSGASGSRPPGHSNSPASPKPGAAQAGSRAGAQAGSRAGTRSATGPAVNFGYGTISVRATVHGSRIVAVSVAKLSVLEPTSSQICGEAIPMLRQEVLSAQSASINGVSGATYTSQGYVNSLQAALTELHV